MDKDQLRIAHKACTGNRERLKKDNLCGCFFCLTIFSPAKITEWIPEGEGTAICPFCGIDSVIGESSGFPITEEFLSEMKEFWF